MHLITLYSIIDINSYLKIRNLWFSVLPAWMSFPTNFISVLSLFRAGGHGAMGATRWCDGDDVGSHGPSMGSDVIASETS